MKEKKEEKERKEDLSDFFKSLPIPEKLSVTKGTVPTSTVNSEKEKSTKVSTASRTSIEIDVGDVVTECFAAIKEYDLKKLVEKARNEGFKHLKEPEKELLSLGLIKLGEALTFCRNRETLARTGIVDAAIVYADARNHFVHHQLYQTHLQGGLYTKAHELIERLPKIEVLEEKLKKLQECGLEELTKPIRKGQNDFKFNYDHYIVCLRAEFERLKQVLSAPNVLKDISSRVELRAMLENRIRNILAIMVDLTDKDKINKNNRDPCDKQKDIAEKIKQSFVEEFPEFFVLFRDVKKFRNSLCHLDKTLPKPYINIESMLAFAQKLQKMEGSGYVIRLEKQFLSEQKQALAQVEEKKESLKRERDSEKSESRSSEQKPFEKDETEKKIKADKPSEEQKKEEKAPKRVSEGLQLLSGYGSSSDEEEQQKPQDTTNAPTSTPRMGGHS